MGFLWFYMRVGRDFFFYSVCIGWWVAITDGWTFGHGNIGPVMALKDLSNTYNDTLPLNT